VIDFVKVVLTTALNEWSYFYAYLNKNKVTVKTEVDHFGVLSKEVFEMGNSLKFIIRYDEQSTVKRIEMQVSLHKYFADGYNYSDYTFKQLCQTVFELFTIYRINPQKAIIQNIEAGFNVIPPLYTDSLLDSLFMYRTELFKPMKNSFRLQIGIEATLSAMVIKGYNKRSQILRGGKDIGEECFRYELHYNRMRTVNKETCIYCLADLLDYQKINRLSNLVLDSLDHLVYFDNEIYSKSLAPKEIELCKVWSNPKRLQALAKHNPQKYRRQRKLFKALLATNGLDVLDQLKEAISRKRNNVLAMDRTTAKEVNYFKTQLVK
jgi:hypothetical protein